MDRIEQVDLGDVTLHCAVHGAGPVVVCAHGFPDDARSFRKLTPALIEHGFSVVVPTMRGYAPSSISKSFRYDSATLGRDLIGLADHFSPREPIQIIGHDWGAVAAYNAAAIAPERVRSMVTIAVPHLRVSLPKLLTPAQMRRSWYVAFFQLAELPERRLLQDNLALIDRLWRDWSPDYHADPKDLELIKAGIAPRVEHVIGYYRQFMSVRALLGEGGRLARKKTSVPTAYLHGENDGCVGVECSIGVENAFTSDIEVHRIRDVGHFLHLERPDVVNPIITAFLNKTK